MARVSQSRNLKGFGWLTKKKVTYRRDVAKERRELKRQAIEDRKERIALKKLEAEERAADAKIALAQRKIETAGKKADTGGMSETRFEAMKARMEKEIEAQEQHKAAARARAGNPCAQTRKSHVSDRAKRYRANQPGCKPQGVKKCKLCGKKSDLMVDHIDGNESNGRKSNLRWLCRSCNTVLGAEMARTGEGRRTVQYNPQGAQTLGEYVLAVLEHTRGAHDEAGKLIHATPKWKRQEYASEIWAARKARGNPAVSPEQYRLAQAVLSGTARETHMSREAAREIVDRTPAKLRSQFSQRNPAMEFSTEYHLGYNLGQADRQSAQLRKTLDELHATFAANFGPGAMASWESFEQAYQAGYGGQMGAAAPNPARSIYDYEDAQRAGRQRAGELQPSGARTIARGSIADQFDIWWKYGGAESAQPSDKRGNLAAYLRGFKSAASKNPEPQGDGSEEYQQALRTAELFHGRPVKEEIEVKEAIRTHDWYVSIGPLIKLVIKPVTKKPKARVPLPFHQSESGQVQLFCSPDGKQFYLRGGDQELDLDAFGMGERSAWYRDHMLIGEAVEITYRDKKKFHSFKLTDYYHKLGEETRIKPTLAYDSLSKKLEIIGGQYRIEMEDLVDGMSPGIVN
jgi:hypothetical protein